MEVGNRSFHPSTREAGAAWDPLPVGLPLSETLRNQDPRLDQPPSHVERKCPVPPPMKL